MTVRPRDNKKKESSLKRGRPKVYAEPIDMTPRIFIELENVLMDIDNNSLGISREEASALPGVVLSLYPKKDAVQSMKKLYDSGCDIWITTKISNKNHGAVSEKIHWLQQYIPYMAKKLIIAPVKGALGNKDDFLIAQKDTSISFTGMVIEQGAQAFLNDWSATLAYLNDKLNLELKTDLRNSSDFNIRQ